MAEDKKLVEAITSMDVDFAQWYTDVCKKAELMSYSSVFFCLELTSILLIIISFGTPAVSFRSFF